MSFKSVRINAVVIVRNSFIKDFVYGQDRGQKTTFVVNVPMKIFNTMNILCLVPALKFHRC